MKFRVNYRFVDRNFKLRTGAYILDAKDVKEAETAAQAKLNLQGVEFGITKTEPFKL